MAREISAGKDGRREDVEKRIPGLLMLWREMARSGQDLGGVSFAQVTRDLADSWVGMGGEEREELIRGMDVRELDGWEEVAGKIGRAYAVVGRRAAGKGTTLKMLSEYGIPGWASSEVLRQVASALYSEVTAEVLIDLGIEVKQAFGPEVLIRWTLDQNRGVLAGEGGRLAIDGLRAVGEVEGFRSLFGDKGLVVAVTAPVDVAWERVRQRGRGDMVSGEDFWEAEEREEARIKALVGMADVIIDNSIQGERGLARLREQVFDLIKA